MKLATLSRRESLGAILALGLSGCEGYGAQDDTPITVPPLKSLASLPIGCAVMSAKLADPTTSTLLLKNFSQLTAEAEMKMAAIVAPDGRLRFSGADAIMAYAQQNKLRVHGHALVWHKHEPEAFLRLDGNKPAFTALYDNYIRGVMGRYRGRIPSWDVVNEPVNGDGLGLRATMWGRNFGDLGYIERAFQIARETDPSAKLFINEYDLELKPEKRLAFMQMMEALLKKGTPIDGIGTQSHINIDMPKGAAKAAFKDLASFGLPIHVSELDISFGHRRFDWRSVKTKRALQAEQMTDFVQAFMALPEKLRYAITIWGLYDSDSFWRVNPEDPNPDDEPLLFDGAGRAKPVTAAFANALGGIKSMTPANAG